MSDQAFATLYTLTWVAVLLLAVAWKWTRPLSRAARNYKRQVTQRAVELIGRGVPPEAAQYRARQELERDANRVDVLLEGAGIEP